MSLFIVSYLYKLLMGRDGMGNGDFKLFAAFGAWLGWKVLWLIILMSAGAGAIIGITMILVRGRDRLIPIPFGPYLAIAGWIVMLYGESLLDGYLRISGIRH
jgi:leader peptidase (prepilin peptidase)/N-methyltransferase